MRKSGLPGRVLSIAFAVLSVGTAAAQTEEDSGLWLMVFGQGDLGELRWWLDIQPRYLDADDGLNQLLVRPGIGYDFADNASAWLGYAWIQASLQPSGHVDEDRIWQQLLWSPEIELFNLTSRTRLEQRFLDSGDDVGWRFRQFVKGTHPLGFEQRLFLSVYDELFFDLNDTDWGQDPGFSQNRLFAGLGWRFDPEGVVAMEVGYLNQYIDRSGPDQMNHILSINLFLSF